MTNEKINPYPFKPTHLIFCFYHSPPPHFILSYYHFFFTFNLFIAPPWERSDINRKEGGKTTSVEYSVYFRVSLKKRHVPKGQSLKEGANINCNNTYHIAGIFSG